MEEFKNLKKKSRQGAIISFVGIFITLSTFAFFIFNQEKTSKDIEIVQKENYKLIDSTKVLTQFVDSTKAIISKDSKVKALIANYIKYFNAHNTDSILTILNDTLDRYYLKKHVSKYSMAKELETYWQKYPNSSYKYDNNNVFVSKYGKHNFQVIIKGYYSIDTNDTKEVLSYIRVNNKFKIYVTRDYLPN